MAEIMKTYRALEGRERALLWVTAGFWVLGGVGLLASDNPQNPLKGGDVITISNIITIVSALLAAGTVWQQWIDAKARIKKLEEDIPDTYVRKDVYEADMASILRTKHRV